MKKIFLWLILFWSIFALWWCTLENKTTVSWALWWVPSSWNKQEKTKIHDDNGEREMSWKTQWWEEQWWKTGEENVQKPTDNPLQSIKQRFQLWNNPETPYTLEKVDLTWSAEWGVATYYYDGDDLKKVIARYYGETGKELYELYYDQGNDLFFVFQVSTTYARPLFVDETETWGEDEVDKKVEQRYYFDNGTMILRRGEDNQKMASNTNSFQQKEKDLLHLSKELLDKSMEMPNKEE